MDIIKSKNLLELIDDIHKIAKQHQAAFLTELQETLENTPEFKKIRKLYLDSSNDYTRSIIKEIFGDTFEELR